MSEQQQAAIINRPYTNRMRVRTPGKYIVLFLFAPVILIALGAGLWLSYLDQQSRLAALEYRKANNGAETAYFTLPELLVDLSPDQNGRKAFLKLKASLVLNAQDTRKTAMRLDELQPTITERLTFFLRILKPDDFHGSEAQERIKEELLRRVNLEIAPDRVENIVVEELVVQ